MPQIYVKSNEDNSTTSIVITNNNELVYNNVLDVPEITGVHRAISYVKNCIGKGIETDLFLDKTKSETIWKDPYIRYCKVPVMIGNELNVDKKASRICKGNLQQLRINFERDGR